MLMTCGSAAGQVPLPVTVRPPRRRVQVHARHHGRGRPAGRPNAVIADTYVNDARWSTRFTRPSRAGSASPVGTRRGHQVLEQDQVRRDRHRVQRHVQRRARVARAAALQHPVQGHVDRHVRRRVREVRAARRRQVPQRGGRAAAALARGSPPARHGRVDAGDQLGHPGRLGGLSSSAGLESARARPGRRRRGGPPSHAPTRARRGVPATRRRGPARRRRASATAPRPSARPTPSRRTRRARGPGTGVGLLSSSHTAPPPPSPSARRAPGRSSSARATSTAIDCATLRWYAELTASQRSSAVSARLARGQHPAEPADRAGQLLARVVVLHPLAVGALPGQDALHPLDDPQEPSRRPRLPAAAARDPGCAVHRRVEDQPARPGRRAAPARRLVGRTRQVRVERAQHLPVEDRAVERHRDVRDQARTRSRTARTGPAERAPGGARGRRAAARRRARCAPAPGHRGVGPRSPPQVLAAMRRTNVSRSSSVTTLCTA